MKIVYERAEFEKMVKEFFPKGAMILTLRPNNKMSFACMSTNSFERAQYTGLWDIIKKDTKDNHGPDS